MTKIRTHCYSALGLLVVLYFSTAVSLAQKTTEPGSTTTVIDPFAVLPASDAYEDLVKETRKTRRTKPRNHH